MALVAYSDSEGSETEEQPKKAVKTDSKPAQNQSTAAFAVSKTNPRKIQVSLGAAQPLLQRDEDGPPAPKRAKVGSGGIGGFNAMLPAPKKENEKKPAPSGTARKVFSLKTGAEPGFSRQADDELRQLFAEQAPTPKVNDTSQLMNNKEDESENPKLGNPMRFRPLSVARNTKKRPKVPSQPKEAMPVDQTISKTTSISVAAAPTSKPKVSLFSAGGYATPVNSDSDRYENVDEDAGQKPEDDGGQLDATTNHQGESIALSQTQSLDTIASDLNLSASDRRRLFGREGKGSSSAINIVNFNTDQEYAANEALRASGEQVQHHAVRGIAPGKHSLKQLVNAAATQKDALEESFAAGKSNKREAGSRYGW